jgi:hypothetical protein
VIRPSRRPGAEGKDTSCSRSRRRSSTEAGAR